MQYHWLSHYVCQISVLANKLNIYSHESQLTKVVQTTELPMFALVYVCDACGCMRTLGVVSYTHLDVYKRQYVYSAHYCMSTILSILVRLVSQRNFCL